MPKKSSPKKQSKAAFVRELPANTPAKEVVARAKSAGMAISEAYVYNVRATTKTKLKATTLGSKQVGGRGGGAAEDLLRAVAAELGLTRAIGILEAEHARVRRLLGG